MRPFDGVAAGAVASIAAGVGVIEPGAFITTALSMAVLIAACIATYRVAIRETRKEIKAAFDEHLQQLHEEHQALVDEATGAGGH